MSETDLFVCTICEGEFNIETEGGVRGFIGILPVAFCPTCKAGIFDFVEQHSPPSDEEDWMPRPGYPNEDIDEIGQSDQLSKGVVQIPFPDVCAHYACEKTPIVGVNKRFVCEDHIKWVLKPLREVIKLVEDNFRG